MTTSVLPYNSPDSSTTLGFSLHHIQLAIPVGAESKCREYYVRLLGLHEIQKPPLLATRGGLWLRGDGLEVHLGVEEDFRPARKAHPGILVIELDRLAEVLAANGHRIEWDEAFPGFRRFYSSDPVGNRLEFMTFNPGETQ